MAKIETLTRGLIQELYIKNYVSMEKIQYILENIDSLEIEFLVEKAHDIRMKVYGNKIYLRGLIEISNYCKNHCLYCGINKYNKKANRYRLSLGDILECCEIGYKLGFRTFVLQGGEDNHYKDEFIVEMIHIIKSKYPEVAITLSLGEKKYESYKSYFKAGADRYLLRHETADEELFSKIHPGSSFDKRVECLRNLKDIGYQIGAGFMVGIPGQDKESLSKDLLFLKDLDPHMVGIGPFIPHEDTIYKDENRGGLRDTIIMIALTRLFLPQALLPATTALASISPKGRLMGLRAGANVIMPNLSPKGARDKYSLYDGKISSGNEAAESLDKIGDEINKSGFSVDMSRGDNIKWGKNNDKS